MIRSIFLKEWLKLRYYFALFLLFSLGILGYFIFTLSFAFSTVEPESMMWYRFIHLGDKPYFHLSYLYLSFGVVIALVQFLPERIKNRIKIMAHLPLELKQSLFLHLGIGIGFILVLSVISSWIILLLFSFYYPDQIVQIALKDTSIYSFLAVILYMGLSAAILEKKNIIGALKFFFTVVCITVLLKKEYVFHDIFWLFLFFVIPFIVLDSFYSIKEQRLDSSLYKLSLGVLIIALIVQSYGFYKNNYEHEFNRYYIFYSNKIKDFVYQKNFGEHNFEYGIKEKKIFDRKEYESYLPFVYWRNLDIRHQLPVTVEGKEFDKETIKAARLGLSYNPKMLKSLEAGLYPLFNPQSDQGMISFPKEVFFIGSKGAYIYSFDHKVYRSDLTQEFNKKLQEQGFVYPAKGIWGKTTNMKPFDLGYLVLDAKKQLFNIRRFDDQISVTKIDYPKGIDIKFIRISENKQKLLSGYAIDTKGNFYLLSWNFRFVELNLDTFDHKTMKLKLISNPLDYLIRYDNGESYYAVVFQKDRNLDLQKAGSIVIH